RPCADRALDGRAAVPARAQPDLDVRGLRRGQPSRLGRQGGLLRQLRRLPDADKEGPGPARPALLQAARKVIDMTTAAERRRCSTRLARGAAIAALVIAGAAVGAAQQPQVPPEQIQNWTRCVNAGHTFPPDAAI